MAKEIAKGKARWCILRDAVVNNKLTDNKDVNFSMSGRRFTSFGLFLQTSCDCLLTVTQQLQSVSKTEGLVKPNACPWFLYALKDAVSSLSVWIKHPVQSLDLKVKLALACDVQDSKVFCLI